MQQHKNRVKWLFIMYLAMVIVFLGLTVTNQSMDMASIVINIALFVLVFVIFFNVRKGMTLVQEITKDLKNFTDRIEKDFEMEQGYLWEKYKNCEAEEFFKNKILIKTYKKYIHERERLFVLSNNNFKCNLEDYLNEELIDAVIKKNILNLIPGVMTGLGILGTFLGLSMGLQNFNTGNSEEIASSIAPLMDGIKVAFHTSIYGMSFSLVYNFIYKEILEDAYIALNDFLQSFDSYVDSDADADNNSAMQIMLQKMPEIIGDRITDLIGPAMDRMNDTLENFTKNIADSQVEGVAQIVDQFMVSMNSSLGDSFIRLGNTIDKTCELQEQNSVIMQNVLNEIQSMSTNIKDINELSIKTVERMSGYVEKLDDLQNVINSSFEEINEQLTEQKEYTKNLHEYLDILVNYERQIGEASAKFTEEMDQQLAILGTMENKISESTRKNLEMLADKANDYNKTLTEVASEQIRNVASLTEEYTNKVTEHINNLDGIGETLREQTRESIQSVGAFASEYSEKVVSHLNTLDNLNDQVNAHTLDHLNLIAENAKNNTTMLAEHAEYFNKTLTDSAKESHESLVANATYTNQNVANAAKEQIKTVLQFSAQQTGEIDRASQELAKVCKELNNRTITSIKEVFNIFDENLAEITHHLSGTISEIEDTTGRVPQVVKASYDGMKDTFDDMRNKYEGLIQAIELMSKQMENYIKNSNRNNK